MDPNARNCINLLSAIFLPTTNSFQKLSIFKLSFVLSDITCTAWQKDKDSGNMKRRLNYTITINNPLIGKSTTATENQVCLRLSEWTFQRMNCGSQFICPPPQTLYKESRDGQYYVLDSEVYTHDVPYHDYFYTQNRYYVIRNSRRKCRLR